MKKTKEKRKEKVSNEHLSELQKLISGANQTNMAIGSLEVRKHEMLQKMDVINKELIVFEGVLQKEYGTNNIDVTNGNIIYDEQVN
tara:strand:+ start:3805 stop:4062 length:258 start_codon:yes stop_codon:yes gene_type:complete